MLPILQGIPRFALHGHAAGLHLALYDAAPHTISSYGQLAEWSPLIRRELGIAATRNNRDSAGEGAGAVSADDDKSHWCHSLAGTKTLAQALSVLPTSRSLTKEKDYVTSGSFPRS